MDHDAPTIRPRRIQNQNVIHRLERRRISSGKAGTHWHQVRILRGYRIPFLQGLFPMLIDAVQPSSPSKSPADFFFSRYFL
uniref:Uncharacterized protein n=1 Tax=Buteo japonicus TaxID=224669 RepID=A0A8B9Z7T1_9AVES